MHAVPFADHGDRHVVTADTRPEPSVGRDEALVAPAAPDRPGPWPRRGPPGRHHPISDAKRGER